MGNWFTHFQNKNKVFKPIFIRKFAKNGENDTNKRDPNAIGTNDHFMDWCVS